MKRRAFLKLFAVATTVATSSACFGSFQAVRWVYGFNKGISGNKFIQWLMFLVLTIVPVYGVAALIDVWILNSIEFWFGGSAVSEGGEPELERLVDLGNGESLRMRKDPTIGLLEMHYQGGEKEVSLAFVFDEDGGRVLDMSGREIAHATETEAGVEVRADGELLGAYDRAEVDAAVRTYEQGGAQRTAAWARARVARGARDVAALTRRGQGR